MASTDNPLKRLVSTFIEDFASWLLRAEVQAAHPLNVELLAETQVADQVFQVTRQDGYELILHIEFQGCRTQQPMSWRMLEYMTRLASTHRLDLYSVVLYVGQGAGVNDTGKHQVNGPSSEATLSWQYEVIRLWQLPAEDLLALDRPALLALVGQTRITQPEIILPAVVTRLRSEPDLDIRSRLIASLLALMPEEEMIQMVENLIEEDGLLLDTPYLRRIREEGRQEGRQEGLAMNRRHILQTLVFRFALSETDTQPLAQQLDALVDEAQLERLFTAAMQSPSIEAFHDVMQQELPN